MHGIDLGDDIGTVPVTLAGATIEVDVYHSANRLTDLLLAHKESPTTFLAGVVEHLQALGFPCVSHYAADRFAAAIAQRANDLKKKGTAFDLPGSPASMDSAPSD